MVADSETFFLIILAFALTGAAFALLSRTLRIPAATWWAITWFAAAGATSSLTVPLLGGGLGISLASLCILTSTVTYVVGAAHVTDRPVPLFILAGASILWMSGTLIIQLGDVELGAFTLGLIHLGLQATVAAWCFQAPRREGGGVLRLLGLAALISGLLYLALLPFSTSGELLVEGAVSIPAVFGVALSLAFLQIVAVTGWHHRRAKLRDQVIREQSIALVERERSTIAQELHDGACQTLMASKLQLEHAARLGVPEAAQSNFSDAISCITNVINDLRDMSHNLYPSGLSVLGLERAIAELGKRAEEPERQIFLRCQLHDDGLAAPVELALYRILQEALHNMTQHSRATEVRIDVTVRDGLARLRVADNGVGFDPEHPSQGMGLASMRERAEVLGGSLEIHARPGGGVLLEVAIPDRPVGPAKAVT